MRRCEIRIGRIVSHPCAQLAVDRCGSCQKAVCRRHFADDRCVVCAGAHRPPEGARHIDMDELYGFDAADEEAFDGAAEPGLHDFDS